MNKNLTEVVFVLDRSGSMAGLENDTIGGYNSFVEKQIPAECETLITTVLFDYKYEILYNGTSPEKAFLNENNYFVRGCTALYDAVGKTILDIGSRLSHTPEYNRPSKVIFIITTDGYENASREFTKSKVQELISVQHEKYNWEFLFFGANINSAETARSMGISEDNAIDFEASPTGICEMMYKVAECVEEVRRK